LPGKFVFLNMAVAEGLRQGRTPRGRRFVVPPTVDMFATLASPRHWGPAERVALLLMAAHVASLALRNVLPLAVYVALFLTWRTAYNVGIGWLLTVQSQRKTITRWLEDAPPGTKALVKWAVTKSLPPEYRWQNVPVEFNAWVAFRALAMIILANDGLSYVVLAGACFKPIAESSVKELVVCATVGTALVAFSIWSKAAAHDCLGDFAWYWGDFFFLMEGELVFDGVFELFPHPMYTVGYSAYYGISLLMRSYTLFFVSLIAHTMQIIFLVFVEEPHIRKIYGSSEGTEREKELIEEETKSAFENSNKSDTTIEKPKQIADFTTQNHSFEWRLSAWPDLLRVGDIAIFVSLSYSLILVFFAKPSNTVLVLMFLGWRAFQWLGLGYVLERQSINGEWMTRAAKIGMPALTAFDSWKQLWTLSWVMNHAMFILVSFSIAPNPYPTIASVFNTVSISHILGSMTLMWISAYVWKSAHDTLDGEFGFFYSDFFLPSKSKSACYKGVFRYVNNPECALGYLGYYGIAILLQSWSVIALAFIAQAAHAAFVVRVETPHLQRSYCGVRGAAALERTLRSHASRMAEAVPVVGKVRDELKQTARRSTALISSHHKLVVITARKTIDSKREQLVADIASLNSRLREHKLYLRAIEIHEQARTKIKYFDGADIVCMLERHGVTIERVSDMSDADEVSDTSPEPMSPAARSGSYSDVTNLKDARIAAETLSS
jgi:phosphatidylethanolamine N-methyltransferase